MERIQKEDTVIVIAGKSKGRVAKVLKVVKDRVFVEGVNMIKKHQKPNPQLQQEGGIISQEGSVHISNVALYNPITKKADKVGFKFLENNNVKQKVRYFKSNNEIIDRV